MKLSPELAAKCLSLDPHYAAGHEKAILERLSEKEWQALVVAEAKKNGWRYYHVFDSRKSNPGWPDLFLIHVGMVKKLALELKVKPNKPTPAQEDWITEMNMVGIPAFVVYPYQWPMVKQLLAQETV